MDRRNRHIVHAELERLRQPLDRFDTAAVARAQGRNASDAFDSDRYSRRVTATDIAAVLQSRIRRVHRAAQAPPPEPPRLLNVEQIDVGGETINLPRLLARTPASRLADESGIPRSTVQRIKAGGTRTKPDTAIRLLRVVDEERARTLEAELVDAEIEHLRWLAPVLEQLAREGPVREWAMGRQLLAKLRDRLADLDAQLARDPRADLLEERQRVVARITELEEVDDIPPRDPNLEQQARIIREGQRHGAPQLKRAGVDPGGDLPRVEQMFSAFGLKDIRDVGSIDAKRVYKLRARARRHQH